MRVAVLGAGAGGAATSAELSANGHDVVLWNRSAETLTPFQAARGVGFDGVMGAGVAKLKAITSDLGVAIGDAEVAMVVLPTFSHAPMAHALADAGWPEHKPIVLNPGHTGGALEFAHAFRSRRADVPPIAEFSTLTYVARKYTPECVTISGRAKQIRAAALPGGGSALAAALALFPSALVMSDVFGSDFANVNMVLHPPGAIMAAAWVEAKEGAFTFYVEAMTEGVARTMHRLDDERRAVARAFGHELPNLIEEMKLIGTVEPDIVDTEDFRSAISAGEANKRIKAPASLSHRYYREDFGHGLLPFIDLAGIAGVEVPIATSLFTLAQALTGADYREGGRSAEAMGIAGMGKQQLEKFVRSE